jgi:hypothetical protein
MRTARVAASSFEHLDLPHGGVRTVHQETTCLAQLTLGPQVMHSWSRYTLGGNELRVLRRVDRVTRPSREGKHRGRVLALFE